MNRLGTSSKRNGEPCTLQATEPDGFCWAHSPINSEHRKRTASRGGRGKAAKRVSILWDEVKAIIARVDDGSLTPPQANSMARLYAILIELAKLDVAQGELEVLETRLSLDVEERRELLPRLERLQDEAHSRQGQGGTY